MAILDVVYAHPKVILGVVLLALLAIWRTITTKAKVPSELPWVGKTSNVVGAEYWASIASFSNTRKWLNEGYEKYTKFGKSYILPDFGSRAQIVIPPNQLHWLVNHKDTEASVGAVHYEQLMGQYAFTDANLLKLLYHEHVIHRSLVRKLKDIIPGTQEEIASYFDKTWGFDTQSWKDICVFSDMTAMIAQVSNRMFVGLPLCRDQGFLKLNAAFANDVITCIISAGLIPKFLQPVFGPILSIPNHYHAAQVRKYTLPIIEQRLADIAEKDANPDSKIEIPEDYFTMHIRMARAEGKTYELDPNFISRCLLAIEFAAIHTTTFTATLAFFDLIASDPKDGYLEGLQEEIERVYRACNGVWDKTSLNKLVRTDSALRETMRLSDMIPSAVGRKVLAPEGIKNEEEGWTAPYGSYITIDAFSRRVDPKYFPNPDKYDAFRFSRPREEYEAKFPTAAEKDPEEYLRLQNTSSTSTGENFLYFGHGRHACPGRFFVQQELKMILAYMFLNYDVQRLPERPPNSLIGSALVPPTKATIKIRRKANPIRLK